MRLNRKWILHKNRIYISILGGFGNNLFQVALARRLESLGYEVKFDISAKKRAKLELLEIPSLSSYVEARIANWTRFIPNPIGKNARLSKFIIENIFALKLFISLQSNGSEPEVFQNGLFLTGYWQNLNNASYLQLAEMPIRQVSSGMIAVHVRRGDMIVNFLHPLDRYYRDAVNEIRGLQSGVTPYVKVFTDDATYCSKELNLGCDFKVVEGGTTISDFLEMISSEYLIISRSTFSLWAGYFSNGTVYCPSPWEVGSQEYDRCIFPSEWIRILA